MSKAMAPIPVMSDDELDRRREEFLRKDKASEIFVLFDTANNQCLGVFNSLGIIVDTLERAYPEFSVVTITSHDPTIKGITIRSNHGPKCVDFHCVKFPRRNTIFKA